MIDRDVALEALGTLCNASVTSTERVGAGAAQDYLSIKTFISTVLESEETCQVSISSYVHLQTVLQGYKQAAPNNHVDISGVLSGGSHFINNDEFFDPQFDYDFTNLRDTETYYRGGEVYERPCGWQRFALKVHDKYDENTWLGNRYRSTESVPGEWPVSYHGTSKAGAEGIIAGFYKPGNDKSRQIFGRGIYSTPYISEAIQFAKTFTSTKTGRTYIVILQNRINPEYRQKHNNDKYWLVSISKRTTAKEEQKMVERAIRPYGLLLKDISNPEGLCSIL
ncbi:uncharacterized protein LOC119893368 [Micropterus salmoides]|uniref:uncharacterized protein LOC119893368 n=1 Tax=Micropterus salmoides TaxID=27706 RepID=UPI0018EE06C2|nr:uncharacterized protein LOC119893368 [Micropterus salmoides]